MIRRILVCAVLALSPFAKAQTQRPLPEDVKAILGDPDATPQPTPDVAAVLGAPAGTRLSGGALEAAAAEISTKLRCPVCQGVAISDSPSSMATHMREQVRELLAQGYSAEQVMTYFEKSYGELVRLEPPMRGLNRVLWLLPVILLLGGGLFVAARARVSKAPSVANPQESPLAPQTVAAEDADLGPYLERVRRDAGLRS